MSVLHLSVLAWFLSLNDLPDTNHFQSVLGALNMASAVIFTQYQHGRFMQHLLVRFYVAASTWHWQGLIYMELARVL